MSEKFEVGGFASYSWGYDQTNVDWFKVVRRNEKSVWFVPVPAEKSYDGYMHGSSVPVDKPLEVKMDWAMVDGEWKQVEKSAVFRRSVKQYSRGGEICNMDFGNLRPWEGQPRFFSEWA